MEQDFEQVGFVPPGFELLAFQADFGGLFLFEQIEGDVAQDGKVLWVVYRRKLENARKRLPKARKGMKLAKVVPLLELALQHMRDEGTHICEAGTTQEAV